MSTHFSLSPRLSVSLLFSVFALPAARAQTAPAPNTAAKNAASETVKLDRFEVRAAAAPALANLSHQNSALPAIVSVIDRSDLERTNFNQDFADLLRRIPGVMAHNIGQGNLGTAIKMRGFLTKSHGADTAVYVDGVAQNLPSAANAHGLNDLTWLMPDMIERIEVIKGPFSALYGDQNRAGAVNIVTRTRADNTLATTVGSYGMFRSTATGSATAGPVQILVGADFFHTDGYRDQSGQDRTNLFAKATVTRAREAWSLRAHFQDSDWEAPGFLSVARLRAGTSQPADRDPTIPPLWGDSRRYGLVLTRTPAGTDAGLHASAEIERIDLRRASGANATDLNLTEDHRDTFGARLVDNILVADRAALAFGAEVRADKGDAFTRRWWLSGVPSANYNLNYDLDLLAYGLFAQGQYKLADALKLIGGARLDRFDYTVTNRKYAASSARYRRNLATPRVGLAWAPARGIELFTNYGTGFRSPAMSELSPQGAFGPLGAAGGLSPVTSIKPSTAESYDAGAQIAFGRWHFAASGYHTLNGNEIIEVPVGSGNFQSVGDTTRDGWELEARFRASAALSFYGSYGKIIRARINNPLPNTATRLPAPADTLKAGVAYTVPAGEGRVLLNLDGYYLSGVPYFAGTPRLSLQFARPYSRYDVRATYEIRRVQFTLGAVFQPHRYSSDALLSNAAGVSVDTRPTADVSGTVRYRF